MRKPPMRTPFVRRRFACVRSTSAGPPPLCSIPIFFAWKRARLPSLTWFAEADLCQRRSMNSTSPTRTPRSADSFGFGMAVRPVSGLSALGRTQRKGKRDYQGKSKWTLTEPDSRQNPGCGRELLAFNGKACQSLTACRTREPLIDGSQGEGGLNLWNPTRRRPCASKAFIAAKLANLFLPCHFVAWEAPKVPFAPAFWLPTAPNNRREIQGGGGRYMCAQDRPMRY